MTLEEMKKQKKALHLTNEMLAEKSGVPLGTVQKIMSGITASPRYATLQALESVLAHSSVAHSQTLLSASPDSTAESFRSSGSSSGPAFPFTVSEPGSLNRNWILRDTPAGYGTDSAKTFPPENRGNNAADGCLRHPGNQRAELIDGCLFEMDPSSGVHQQVAALLYQQLSDLIDSGRGTGTSWIAPTAVQLDADGRTVVEPDVFIVCDLGKITRERIIGAPDLIAEILSPGTRNKDLHVKWQIYEKAGVREYWIINPDTEQILKVDLEHGSAFELYSFEDPVPVSIWNGKCKADFRRIRERLHSLFGDPRA